jgi:hypothetical protein
LTQAVISPRLNVYSCRYLSHTCISMETWRQLRITRRQSSFNTGILTLTAKFTSTLLMSLMLMQLRKIRTINQSKSIKGKLGALRSSVKAISSGSETRKRVSTESTCFSSRKLFQNFNKRFLTFSTT